MELTEKQIELILAERESMYVEKIKTLLNEKEKLENKLEPIEKNICLKETWQLLGTPYRPKKYSLMDSLKLGDFVAILHDGVFEGVVTLINIKGVGLYTDDGYKFAKWCNVISKK